MALSLFRFTLSSSALLAASTAVAEVPKVVTDIAPVHALVSQVMGDLGQPDLLVDPGNSPTITACALRRHWRWNAPIWWSGSANR